MPKLEDQTNMYLVNPVNTGMQDWSQTNISIIIPAYNCHNTIIQTLASIAMQENVHEIETIIADDCSDYPYDDIAKIFSKFMKIKVVRLLKGGGPGTARQVGYDHSIGKYVSFMDADDSLISCDSINILKRVMIEKDQDCVYGQFLEQNENGDLHVHEIHMVWMFGKLYKRSFLEHYNIRMNMSHSNEDTGFNCVVKGCSNKVWYIPKPVYTWRFKPNSITRFNNGMYGSESGMCGYLTNMIWQIKELEKRFVNKNYILHETIAIMCTLYHFYVENQQRYPLGTEANLEWCRYYYEQCYKPYEHLIDEATLNQIFMQVAAGQNIAGKGVIPKITFFDFMKLVKEKPYTHNPMHDVGGSVIEIPQTTPENYPVKVTEYMDNIMEMPKINTNTNLARMDGMQRMLDKDRDQRQVFLEENIIPNVKEPIEDKSPKDFNTLTPYSSSETAKSTTDPVNTFTPTPEEIELLRAMRRSKSETEIVTNPCSDKTVEKISTEIGDVIPNPYELTCADACEAHYEPNPNEVITVTGTASDCACACSSASCSCGGECSGSCSVTCKEDVPKTHTSDPAASHASIAVEGSPSLASMASTPKKPSTLPKFKGY